MRRTILTLAAVLAATAAHAQTTNFSNIVDPEEGLPLYQRKFMPPPGYVPPDQRALVALSAPIVAPTLVKPERVVINGGLGGNVGEHQSRFWVIKQQGANVEMRGGCWSACTLITSFIPKERLCFAPGAFLAFHAARTPGPDWQPMPGTTMAIYRTYPAEIQNWIDRHGGPAKMTVETYWTMYDRDLWAMGYPRCK